tara:strand:+ start:25016 stop:27367 length:2352 start_codon:yes stop_codon:yes gene_type:complete
MQSILLATPSKVSKLEASNESKLSDDTSRIHDKAQEGKSATRFASVLENTVSEGKKQDTEGESLSLAKGQTSKISASAKEGKAQGKSKEAEGDPLSLGKGQASKISASANEVKAEKQSEKAEGDPLSLGKGQTSKISASPKEVKVQEKSEEGEPLSLEKGQTSKVSAFAKEAKNSESKLLSGETVSEDSFNEKNSNKQGVSTVPAEKIQNTHVELATENFVTEANAEKTKEVSVSPLTKDNAAAVKSHLDSSIILPVDGNHRAETLKAKASSIGQNNRQIHEDKPITATSNNSDFSKKLSEGDTLAIEELMPLGKGSDSENIASKERIHSIEMAEIDSLLAKGTPKYSDITNANEVKSGHIKEEIDSLLISEDTLEGDIEGDSHETLQSITQQVNQLNTMHNDRAFMNTNGSEIKSISSGDEFSDEALEVDAVSTDAVISNVSGSSDEMKSSIETTNHKTSDSEVFTDEEVSDELISENLYFESDLDIKDQPINPILAQIQASQQTDTKVNESKIQISSIDNNNVLKDNNKSDKSSAKDLTKADKANFENVLADTAEESSNLEKEMINKANLSANVSSNEKIEGMLANFRAEGTKPIFNQSTENPSLNALGVASASADKLLHQSQSSAVNSALQSSGLQQPLELQAKHASAMVGERIMMMLNQGKQEVTIRLDPAELGSMHIKLHVQQDQLQVAIQTQVGQSRDIIEQNLPRLREQLAQQGINLGEASVEQQSRQQQSNSQDSSQMGSSSQGRDHQGESFIDEQTEFFPTQIPLPAQGIDYYA